MGILLRILGPVIRSVTRTMPRDRRLQFLQGDWLHEVVLEARVETPLDVVVASPTAECYCGASLESAVRGEWKMENGKWKNGKNVSGIWDG